jgi:aconitate hydratase
MSSYPVIALGGVCCAYAPLPPEAVYYPKVIQILMENVMRHQHPTEWPETLQKFEAWRLGATDVTIPFYPNRVLLQDFTGVPLLTDLAGLREACLISDNQLTLQALRAISPTSVSDHHLEQQFLALCQITPFIASFLPCEEPSDALLHQWCADILDVTLHRPWWNIIKQHLVWRVDRVNPVIPVTCVIDHSIQVTHVGANALKRNEDVELSQHEERYAFLKWAIQAFDNFQVVPPGQGICHQVNAEHLTKVVDIFKKSDGTHVVGFESMVGTDSHTTMIGGMGVLGWGVGGLEAEAVMMGRPIMLNIPRVVRLHLTGLSREYKGCATEIALHVVERLRATGVVDALVEVIPTRTTQQLSIPDRMTIANMSPESGATCIYFPIDHSITTYLKNLYAPAQATTMINRIKVYQRLQSAVMPYNTDAIPLETVHLNLKHLNISLAGPKKPEEFVPLQKVEERFEVCYGPDRQEAWIPELSCHVRSGDVVLAAITSCTNTANPVSMLSAGLTARACLAYGLRVKPWVKASLAPGSQVVTDYLIKGDYLKDLEDIGFTLVGYGCTTCIGNAGPLLPGIEEAILKQDMTVCAVLSGNRNFEGRIHQCVKANWLCSPCVVVNYAVSGTILTNMDYPILTLPNGRFLYFTDLLFDFLHASHIADKLLKNSCEWYATRRQTLWDGSAAWLAIPCEEGALFKWSLNSTYLKKPPFFQTSGANFLNVNIVGAHALLWLGDGITTDHISPAGPVRRNSPAANFLQEQSVSECAFNVYGARRGNFEVMVRGTFANHRLSNRSVAHHAVPSNMALHVPSNTTNPVYDVAMRYVAENIPLVILAGKEYGTGSSRDWAAKGTYLLGVKAVIAVSFERIHRANLVGMGVLPLQLPEGSLWDDFNMNGQESFDILHDHIAVHGIVPMIIRRDGHVVHTLSLMCRIDTSEELMYYRAGGLLPYVLSNL